MSVFYAENKQGKAVVGIYKEIPFIEYYDSTGKAFFREEFPEKSIAQVEEIANEWADGYHLLFG